MKENERKRELSEQASLKPTFIKIKNFITKSSLGYYIIPNSIQFTKICKSNTITGGESGKKHKNKSKSRMWQTISQGLQKLVAPAKFPRGCEFANLARFATASFFTSAFSFFHAL